MIFARTTAIIGFPVKQIIFMKNLASKYIIMSVLMILLSCRKDNKDESQLILGRWDWVKTVIPYGGQVSNPASSGYSQKLEFMENGKMNEYRNDLLSATSLYTLELNPSVHNNSLLKSSIITSHFYFINDTLIFSEAYVDGPVMTYARTD
jgi:hypothetical protein